MSSRATKKHIHIDYYIFRNIYVPIFILNLLQPIYRA